jgi:hypothetical protein
VVDVRFVGLEGDDVVEEVVVLASTAVVVVVVVVVDFSSANRDDDTMDAINVAAKHCSIKRHLSGDKDLT